MLDFTLPGVWDSAASAAMLRLRMAEELGVVAADDPPRVAAAAGTGVETPDALIAEVSGDEGSAAGGAVVPRLKFERFFVTSR